MPLFMPLIILIKEGLLLGSLSEVVQCCVVIDEENYDEKAEA